MSQAVDHHPVQPDPLHWAVEVGLRGPAAALRVTGPQTVSARRQLNEMLDWLIVSGLQRVSGLRRVSVDLAGAEQVDSRLLQLLCGARRRCDGRLVVTTAGARGCAPRWSWLGSSARARPGEQRRRRTASGCIRPAAQRRSSWWYT